VPSAERKTESRSPDVPFAWRDGGGTAADLRFVPMASHKPVFTGVFRVLPRLADNPLGIARPAPRTRGPINYALGFVRSIFGKRSYQLVQDRKKEFDAIPGQERKGKRRE
jgi:hypothetical protein